MSSPTVSVVVTACGDSPLLREGLARLATQAQAADAETILALNVAQESVPEASRAALSGLVTRTLYVAEPGKSRALNAAVGGARGEVVAFTDDDALVDAGWLAAITTPILAEDGEIVGCGGPVLPVFPEGGAPPWLRHLLGRTRSTFLGPYHFLGNRALDYAETDLGAGLPFGASCAYARSALLAHPFRVELGPNRQTGLKGGEDTELALHLLRAGHRLRYVPEARVWHPVAPERMTYEDVCARHRALGRETIRMQRALGDEVPSVEELRAHIASCAGFRLRRVFRRRNHKMRRELRRLTLEGQLEEVLAS